MRILFCIHQFYPHHISGTERVVLTAAHYLQKLGHNCTVLAYSFNDKLTERFDDNIIWGVNCYEDVKIINCRMATPCADLNARICHNQFRPFMGHVLDMCKPDIVHVAHCMRVGAVCWEVIQRNIPYVMSLTDFWLLCHKATMQFDEKAMCAGNEAGAKCEKHCAGLHPDYYFDRFKEAQLLLSSAGSVVVSSEWLEKVFKDNVKTPMRLASIPYGVDRSYLGLNAKSYGPGYKGKLVFLFSGSLVEHKGVNVLLDAISRCRAKNVEFRIYGEGPLQPRVEALAAKDGRVKFFGVYDKSQSASIIEDADVGVIPSTWYENNPIILQEMCASNLPVIATNAGSLPEKILNGRNGILFKMGDSAELGSIFERVARDPSILDGFKSNSYISQCASIEQSTLMLETLYKNVLGESMIKRQGGDNA